MIVLSRLNPRGIIWLASYPRSGNTWTRAVINALMHIVDDPGYADLDLNAVHPWTAGENDVEHYTRMLGRPAFRAAPAEIAAMRPRVQADIANRAGRPVFVKTHNAQAIDRGHPMVNPGATAGAVYLVRNPLDIAIYLSHFTGRSIDRTIDDMARPGFGLAGGRRYVHSVWGSWSENVGSWAGRPNPTTLVVRYEDMLEKPFEAFEAVARHVAIAATGEQLERALALARFDRLQAKEASDGFQEQPSYSTDRFFREGRAGQWQERLTQEQVARVIKAHHPFMRRFGYLPGE